MLNFILGILTGLTLAVINIILVYIFRRQVSKVISSPSFINEQGEILELEEPIDKVKKLLFNEHTS